MTTSPSKRKDINRRYPDINQVRCPICKGPINSKWFSFRSGNVIEFIAECWSGETFTQEPYPRHIFYFQIEAPDASRASLYPAKGSKVFKS